MFATHIDALGRPSIYRSVVFDNFKKTNNLTKSKKDMDDIMQAALITQLYRNTTKCSGIYGGHVSVQAAPANSRQVVVERDFEVGEFKLQCYGNRFKEVTSAADDNGKSTPNHAEVEIAGIKRTYEVHPPMYPKNKEDQSTPVIPFWYVRHVDLGAENCTVAREGVKTDGINVTFPYIVNTKALAKGGEATIPNASK